MSEDLKHWLQRPVKLWQAILLSVVLMTSTALATYNVSSTTKEYQYNNLRRQKDLVEKRVGPIELDVKDLSNRVAESEIKINAQLIDSRRTQLDLEHLMYKADPEALRAMARRDVGGIHQTASPTINVSPNINTGK